ncbi:MAG: hypothetical protein WA474_02625 [Candidatus Sulfotelmatobacter sp.]
MRKAQPNSDRHCFSTEANIVLRDEPDEDENDEDDEDEDNGADEEDDGESNDDGYSE